SSSMRSVTSSTDTSSRTASLLALQVVQMRSGRPGHSVPATVSRSSCRVTALSQAMESAATGRSAMTTSGVCWSSRVSLSEDLRSELAAIAPKADCDKLAELSGLFHTAGSVHLRGRGEVSLHLDVASSGVARRAFRLLRDLGVGSEIRTYRRHAFDQSTRYQLYVDGDARAVRTLFRAGVLTQSLAPLEHPPRRVVAKSCCRAAYLRGALLGGGSLSGPRSPHLEVRSSSVAGARFIAGL